MNPKAFVLLLMLFSTSVLSLAQSRQQEYSVRSKKAIRLFEESENYFIRRQYGQAVQLLKESLGKEEDFLEAHLRLGAIYRAVGQYDEALAHLEQANQLADGAPNPQALFSLGELYWQLGKYEQAEKQMTQFLSLQPRQKALVSIAENIVADAAFALEQLKNPLPFKPEPLPAEVNEAALQYFPVLTVDQQNLIFTRRLTPGPQDDEDLVISRRDEQGNWQAPVSISSNINTEGNEGTSTISADGRTLIFTSCRGRNGYGSCDLFISYKTGNEWSEPKNLGPIINSAAWESQPALSADGRTLYFVSNRPGGVGQNDIYRSMQDETGNWEVVENLGKTVNTSFDEVSPFIHANGQTLYFGSNGRRGMGGYDLFVTEQEEEGWQEPRNLGYPINNHEDQVSLFVTADGEEGYYAYEEKGGGANDRSLLYRFKIPEAVQVRNRSNYVSGKVYDAETKKPLGAAVTLFDIVDEQVVNKVSSDSVNGTYYIVLTEGSEYALYVNKPGYLFKSLAFNYGTNNTLEPIAIDVYLEPIRAGVSTTLNNIFFETDEYQLQPKSETELERVVQFLKENPKVAIEIAGHTDNVGNASYNQQLSEKRARAVYNFLVEAGISPSRLQAKGYGQSKPIAPNDTEENRQKNRRIEFRVL
ncbi:OmpA family protein [Nafulsella turpanensis]|uniref:OmpA family protein n=1 Tax=Nafulsella turpanensis TaxID=1265690 RepID=UPI0003481570|nr:OmpA family protein [Nafulsella turpanensis]